MRFCMIIAILGMSLVATADPTLVQEAHFFGVPTMGDLSSVWFSYSMEKSVSGFYFPADVDVLRLSNYDYRFIALDNHHLFIQFRINQQGGAGPGSVTVSGDYPEGCDSPVAKCQVRQGNYFNPQTDRVAVAFITGQIAIYRFDRPTGQFSFDRILTNPDVKRPVSLYWALVDHRI
jgi:hypothetical protein